MKSHYNREAGKSNKTQWLICESVVYALAYIYQPR